MRTSVFAAALGVITLGGAVAAFAATGHPALSPPYLSPGETPDPTRFLPAPPPPGGPQDIADKTTFAQTRALQGGARWTMASDDARDDLPALYRHFSCAVGVPLTPSELPALNRIFMRAAGSGQAMVTTAKLAFARPRPFVDNDKPICEPRTAALAREPDYPSGHATVGWALALILTELAPDRATEALTRGRAYGQSRVVCGSHTVSAVEAGFLDGAAWVAALHGTADFRNDMNAARTELAALRAKAAPLTCPAEDALDAASPY